MREELPDAGSGAVVSTIPVVDGRTNMERVHGAVGFTWDSDAQFFYKRAKQNDTLLGYQGWQRQRIADLVLDAP